MPEPDILDGAWRPSSPAATLSLLEENNELRARLEEAEETLRAIRSGEVEALVVEGPAGPQIFTLMGVDAESNQFRGEILGQISDAVVAIDTDQRVIYINPAAERQYGITASETLGLHRNELWTPEWISPEDEAAAALSLRENGRWRGENIHVKRTGEKIHVESAVIRMHDAKGADVGLIATIRDITERKAGETARNDEARRKDEFLAMLGHELRNPLSAICHAVQVTKEADGDAGAQQWANNVIERQSLQLSRMVDDLLDVARINSGRIELRIEALDLSEVISRAVDVVKPQMEQRRHTLTTKIEEGGLHVQGDAARLEQIFVNLLNNAVKYTPEGGRLGLEARREGTQISVSVSDNGIGISPDVLPHIFDLFAQATTSLDRAQGGLGIGLTVVKSLVEMHGGSVSAESRWFKGGTTFTVKLPRCSKVACSVDKPGDDHSSTAAEAGQLPALRVLIVDDHHDGADTLARLLSQRNCEVCVAYDGGSAVQRAHEFLPEVLLLDLGLPGLDGFDLARMLRAEPPFADSLFIAMSGYAQERDIEHSRAAGFDHHFAKPIKLPVLLRVLDSFSKRDATVEV